MSYSYGLKKAIEKYGFTPIPLPKNAKYEEGKSYWCGYWSKWYTVEKVTPMCDEYRQELTVIWEDGHKGTHCTTLDPYKDYELRLDKTRKEESMKIFVVHVYLGCCSNNSDGKLWIAAGCAEEARLIAEKYTHQPIGAIEEYNLENEVVFSSFRVDPPYSLERKTDNWGEFKTA